MTILGIHDGKNASAAVMIDGKFTGAAQEERFTGVKGWTGYPARAVSYCLRQAGLGPAQPDLVVLASVRGGVRRRRRAADALGLPLQRVLSVRHEECHEFYAYLGSPFRGPALVVTAGGLGDYSDATVSRFDDSGRHPLHHTAGSGLGYLYQCVTSILGMEPRQDEYKVMGLAPYAPASELTKSRRAFGRLFSVRGFDVKCAGTRGRLCADLRRRLAGHRFDGIAGAAQKIIEDTLALWLEKCCAKTGLRRVCFSGGVAQNVKADKRLGELDCVDELYVCPAAGDTSLSLGACYHGAWLYGIVRERPGIMPLGDIYLGPDAAEADITELICDRDISRTCRVERPAAPGRVARLLADGLTIGRCAGRMEFGLRALGNRSILADPRRPEMVAKINAQIKFRDFWMPFTPTILAAREADYIHNPKHLLSPFMALAFDTKAAARRDLAAALHPADGTVRPQILTPQANPAYYRLIRAFEKITGVGALLNTSFNLHGEPIVLGPREAWRTFERSGLDGLLLGDTLILRRK